MKRLILAIVASGAALATPGPRSAAPSQVSANATARDCALPYEARWQPASVENTIYLFMQVGKTGSSTMRDVLSKLPVCVIAKGGHNVCRGDAVVTGAQYGDCARISGQCRYFTILREPLAHQLSGYDYFCRGCKDGKRFCGGKLGLPNVCPALSFRGWVEMYGNQYTQHFSREWSHCDTYYNEYVRGFPRRERMDETHLARAIAALSRRDFLVLTTDTLDASGWARLDAFLGLRPAAGFAAARGERVNEFRGKAYNLTELDEAAEARADRFDHLLYARFARST